MARRQRDEYFSVALEILSRSGFKSLTITELCTRLGVTKGSFHHHFGVYDEFVRELISYWELTYSDLQAKAVQETPGFEDRLSALAERATALPHEAESALRSWAGANSDVAEAIRRVDHHREELLQEALCDVGIDIDTAAVYARMSISILIGAQQRLKPVDRSALAEQFNALTSVLLAQMA